MSKKSYIEEGLGRTEYNDSFFERLFKSKDSYYSEGIIICGRYYKEILNEHKLKFKNEKMKLEIISNRNNIMIDLLREKIKILKEQQKKATVNENQKYEILVPEWVEDYMDIVEQENDLINELEQLIEKYELIESGCSTWFGLNQQR